MFKLIHTSNPDTMIFLGHEDVKQFNKFRKRPENDNLTDEKVVYLFAPYIESSEAEAWSDDLLYL